jgi:SAM-dependent methyltransferase
VTHQPAWAPDEIDIERPSVARMYDFYLGGSHNFEADRTLTQFLDLGSGIPTVGNVHEIARALNPDSRVVYVDIDPVAVAHSRALLDEVPGTAIVHADVRDADTILSAPQSTALLDFSRPVAVMMVALLHFIPDADDPASVIAPYRAAISPGSHLALSHATLDGNVEVMRDHEQIYRRSATPINARTHAQVTALLDGFDLIDPGVVHLPLWRPDPDEQTPEHPERYSGYAAVARLP